MNFQHNNKTKINLYSSLTFSLNSKLFQDQKTQNQNNTVMEPTNSENEKPNNIIYEAINWHGI